MDEYRSVERIHLSDGLRSALEYPPYLDIVHEVVPIHFLGQAGFADTSLIQWHILPAQVPVVPFLPTMAQSGYFRHSQAGACSKVSPINDDEIQDLREQIADLERGLLLEQIALKIDEQNMKRSLEVAKLSAEIAERHLESMRMALEQAANDLERKNISEFEYRNVSRNRDLAEINYLNSLIAVYNQLGTLLQENQL